MSLADVGLAIGLVGASAMVALGIMVALVRPRQALNFAFAGYAVSGGLAIGLIRLFGTFGIDEDRPWTYEFIVPLALCGIFLMAVGFLLDRTLLAGPRSPVVPLLLVPFAFAVADRIGVRLWQGADLGLPPREHLFLELDNGLGWLVNIGTQFVLLLVAWRTQQRQWRMPPSIAAILTVGLVALPGFMSGWITAESADGGAWHFLLNFLKLPLFFLAGAIWLAGVPALGRPALVAALSCFAFPALGVLFVFAPSEGAAGLLALDPVGTLAVVTAAILAYGILRHQMFDIDLKVKWTLKRGTIAAIFLGVFFVASKVAENLVASRFQGGNAGIYIGGAACGLLLFALAPLQRLAEGLAERTMPNVRGDDPAYILRKKRETYRNAYATACGDGSLTPKDARLLAEVKSALGLPAEDYAAIERDWAQASAA